MKTRSLVRGLLVVVVAVVLMFGLGLAPRPDSTSSTEHTLRLQAPAFIRTAYAQEKPTDFDLGVYLDQEAGISAYYKSSDAITLSQVRGQFRTIEIETADYIIGSVAMPNHGESYDVHVYVHKTGWILAYYLRADPVSKIVDVYNATISTTKLKVVVSIIAGAVGAPFTDVTYYDFRYPNATNMLFVAEDIGNGNDFIIQLPSSYGYFECGWALVNWGSGNGNGTYFEIDGVRLFDNPGGFWGAGDKEMHYGIISASQLVADTPHTIFVDDYGVLVIVYRVP